MSIKGKAETYIKMRGSLSLPEAMQGKSAYEIAVINGFNGTVEEWLASLKGKDGDTGKDGAPGKDGEKGEDGKDYTLTEADKKEIVDSVIKNLYPAKIGTVTLLADKWIGNASPYSQIVEVEGATENSQVDLTPSAEQLAIFHGKDLAFVTENEDGVVTVYAIGQKPENDYSIQVTITEVKI